MDFSPKCYLFRECKSDRIGQNMQNEVSPERSSRGPSIFQDKSGRLKERCGKDKTNNPQALNESSFEM